MAVVVIDTIKPKNNGTFPVVEAGDVKVNSTQRLPAALDAKANQSDFEALSAAVSEKASQSELTALSSVVANKADKTALAETNAAVALKASQDDLNTTNAAVATKANADDVEAINSAVALKADKTETESLQNQINNIVTPVTQDAEVQNARVGYDGTSYTNLKDRLDTEDTDFMNSLSQNVVEVVKSSERNHTNASAGNTTFSWLDYKTCHVTNTGSSAARTFYSIYSNNTALPKNIKAGATYLLNISGAENCTVDIFTVNESGSDDWAEVSIKQTAQTFLTIPADAVGLLYRIGIWESTEISIDETIETSIVEVPYELSNIITSRYISTPSSVSYTSINDIDKSSVIFVSSDQGVPTIADVPFAPAYVLTICYNNNYKFQICYPFMTSDKAQYRNLKNGTWDSWRPMISGAIQSLNTTDFNDANNINVNSIIFVSSDQGVPSMSNTPVFPCWIETHGVGTNVSNIVSQICYPYNEADKIYRRIKKAGTWTSWSLISGGGGTTTIEQEISRDTYENTYNITTSPTITTSTNGWLQAVDTDTADETNKTDMTGAIMSMLNDTGYCHLSEGIFYVSGNIDMPTGSTLEGCGRNTIIRLLESVSSGYICRVKEYSTIKSIRFSGGYNQLDISAPDIGGRKGIIAIGNRDGQTPSVTPSVIKNCHISDCWFENLDSGIYGYNSGGGLEQGLTVSDCYITRCKAGINLDYWVEYCKFTNVVTFQCYYACINNGGNNVFTACTFHGVIGMQIDNSTGTKANIAHGSVIGCTFNHIDNMNHPETLGNGYGIKIIDADNGFIFSGCQIWYGKIYVESSKGVQVSNTLLGGYPTIETIGDDTVFFSNCIFSKAVTKSTASPVIFNNCYQFNGTPVT